MLKLQFRDRRQKAIWLVDETYTVGRAPDNNLVIDAPKIADQHIKIIVDHNQLTLMPLANNQVMVNQQSVSDQMSLKANDIISIAGIELEIVDPQSTTYQGALGIKASTPATWQLATNASWMENKVFPIDKKMTIGRDPACDISVPVEHMSRRHAEVEVKGGSLCVRDLNSSNGTYLNGQKIQEAYAKPGDKIKVDVVTFTVEGPDTDPNKTIIRNDLHTPKPATAKSPINAKGNVRPNDATQRPLAADKTQEWISNKTIPQVRSEPNYGLILVGGLLIAALVGTGLYFVL